MLPDIDGPTCINCGAMPALAPERIAELEAEMELSPGLQRLRSPGPDQPNWHPFRHGTVSAYRDHGCRCASCGSAYSAHLKQIARFDGYVADLEAVAG